MNTSRFQSAPRTFMRGDRCTSPPTRPRICFNPRPALSCGATRLGIAVHLVYYCFNPRPALSCGATCCDASIVVEFEVSIRAPHFHAGRPKSGLFVTRCRPFQSAPRTFMRGDGPASRDPRDGVVSIRAPHFHAGRHVPARRGHHPLYVSIRAPHFHAGRPTCRTQPTPACLFQSAPRTFMRGDASVSSEGNDRGRFNPRPALSCGATSAAAPAGSRPDCFNPRPALSCGATTPSIAMAAGT